MRIQRGTVCLADLNPPKGTEPGKIRPVLVVQTDLLNGHHPSTLVCPLTTNVKRSAKHLRVHLPGSQAGLDKDSDVMIDQLRAIDNRRMIKPLGSVSEPIMQQVSENLALVLDLLLRSE
ncbi:MAG: type II toxin-antitoxin system PemK/MazF family toxin [Elusimicrobia bacterium]|nr:type II toxin-antitoxin system PemK/MazF family toxin [Elusimicrobiota bacterium]